MSGCNFEVCRAPVLSGDPPHLLPHPPHVAERTVVQGQEEHLGAVGQLLHQAAQGRLGAPQALQEARLVGEGVNDEGSQLRTLLVGELPVQSSDGERVREVPWLRTVRHGLFGGSYRDSVTLEVGGQFISDQFQFPPSYGHKSCQNNTEEP